jgi:hypothetical protein
VSLLDTSILASAMVAGALAGLYVGLGLNAETALDRVWELGFGVAIWVEAIAGALFMGRLGTGLALGALVLLILWSFLHFPGIKTLETPMPRLAPLVIMVISIVTTILLGLAIVLDGVT